MKRPTPDEMRLAAEWLRCNEGDGGEADACNAVADWLSAQADDADLRAACKEAQVSVASVRRAAKAAERTDRALQKARRQLSALNAEPQP